MSALILCFCLRLKTGEPTNRHPGHYSFSDPDIAVCDPSVALKFNWQLIMIFVEVITSHWFWKLLAKMTNPLLNTGNSTMLTGCPSALCVCRGCLTGWNFQWIQWLSLSIFELKLQTKPFSNPTSLNICSSMYPGSTMLVNKLLNSARKHSENFSTFLLLKMYSPFNNKRLMLDT